MEKQFGINISEQQLVFDMLVTQVETLWDVYSSPEELEKEDMMDTFIGSCRLLERFREELGWNLPNSMAFNGGMNYYRNQEGRPVVDVGMNECTVEQKEDKMVVGWKQYEFPFGLNWLEEILEIDTVDDMGVLFNSTDGQVRLTLYKEDVEYLIRNMK